MDRKVVGIASIDIGADIRADEKTLIEEDSRVARLAIRSGTFSMEMMEMQILHFSCVSSPAESLNEDVGNAGDAA